MKIVAIQTYGKVKCKNCGTRKVGIYIDNKCTTCYSNYKKNYKKKVKMTPDDLYELGYNDGKVGKAMEPAWMVDSNYMLGYEDGKGDFTSKQATSEDFTAFNDPPEGFQFTAMKRVPNPYEFYLSKNGNATYLTRPRANNQTRHILSCSTCGSTSAQACLHHSIKGRA